MSFIPEKLIVEELLFYNENILNITCIAEEKISRGNLKKGLILTKCGTICTFSIIFPMFETIYSRVQI